MILALETAFDQCSVALYSHVLLGWQLNRQKREQTQSILPMIEHLLMAHQISKSSIHTIAFSAGPGSFSGIRINTAVAQALAWVNDWRVCAVSSLQAAAQAAYRQKELTQVLVVMDAYMGEFYVGQYALDTQNQIMQPLQADMLMKYEAFEECFSMANTVLVGQGFERLKQPNSWDCHIVLPSAVEIAQIAHQMVQQGQDQQALEVKPQYLRHHAWKTLDEQKRP